MMDIEKNNQIQELERKVKRNRALSIFFAIVAIVSIIIAVYSLTNVNKYVEVADNSQAEQALLQAELDSVLAEYEKMKAEYGELNEKLTAKDSAILAQAEEIQKLISSQADYRRIKKKLELLQDQGKEYVSLLDSLYTVNKNLTITNEGLTQEVSQLNEEKTKLSEEKEQLQAKVTTASKLKAYNVSLKAYTAKSQETIKSRRVKAIKTTFTLSENDLTPAGPINIYARISLPDGRVLALGKGDAYSFLHEDKQLQYTIKETVNYENKAKSVSLSWELRDGDAAVAGEYHVQLFTDDTFLGEASMKLN